MLNLKYNLVPRILIIHLKRFDNEHKKIKKHISYTSTLDFSKLVSEKSEAQKYNLISIIVHEGMSTNSGHYFCYVKNSNDLWYLMNDASVSQVSLANVLKQNPYMLFYEKEVLSKEFLLPIALTHKVSAPNIINNGILSKENKEVISNKNGINGNARNEKLEDEDKVIYNFNINIGK